MLFLLFGRIALSSPFPLIPLSFLLSLSTPRSLAACPSLTVTLFFLLLRLPLLSATLLLRFLPFLTWPSLLCLRPPLLLLSFGTVGSVILVLKPLVLFSPRTTLLVLLILVLSLTLVVFLALLVRVLSSLTFIMVIVLPTLVISFIWIPAVPFLH